MLFIGKPLRSKCDSFVILDAADCRMGGESGEGVHRFSIEVLFFRKILLVYYLVWNNKNIHESPVHSIILFKFYKSYIKTAFIEFPLGKE